MPSGLRFPCTESPSIPRFSEETHRKLDVLESGNDSLHSIRALSDALEAPARTGEEKLGDRQMGLLQEELEKSKARELRDERRKGDAESAGIQWRLSQKVHGGPIYVP